MNPTSAQFQSLIRPELTLKRRGTTNPGIPMEADNTVPMERRIAGPYGMASLQEAWDKLYKARSILEAEQNHLRDDRIALKGEIDALETRAHMVAARELRIQQLELKAQIALENEQNALEARNSESAIVKLTRAPFDMARSVFGHRK
ncbi:MAG TPA: hypothetical protein VII09_05145 [Opitutaceae bacterium]